MVNRNTAKRAETLRVNCFIFGTVREPPREAFRASRPLLWPEEVRMHQDGGEEDTHLANACLELEAELRRRQWDALERLLPYLEAEDEWDDRHWIERLQDLPHPAFEDAARAAVDAWWIAGWE